MKQTTLAEALRQRGDLTLRNSSLEGALYTISELFGVNIVTGELDGVVNGVFRDATLQQILDGILQSNGYGYRPAGESLVVSRLSEFGQVNPFFESATIAVEAANVQEVMKTVEMLKSPQGSVRAIESARTIFVLDFPERVKMIREVVESLDAASLRAAGDRSSLMLGGPPPLEVAYFRTQFISAASAGIAIQAVLSKDGRFAAIDLEDRLVIVDYSENLEMARRVLERMDRPRPQVKITALIYDISIEDIEELGINWNHDLKSRVDSGGNPLSWFSIDSVLKAPFSAGVDSSTLTFMNLSRHFDLSAVILALQNAKDSRLLADPFVVVEENEQAVFQSVSEIPYQQLTQTAGGGNIGTTAFKEAGITLRVRPKVAIDGTIRMEVSPEFSTLTGFTPGDNQPIIDRRTNTTSLRVANKQTVVIGGLRQRSDVGDFRGVPHLKDWKYLGKLFRARETTVRESELVVFLFPEIVGYAPPLNPRERLVADTIGCRLDGIPPAEGCGLRTPCSGAPCAGGMGIREYPGAPADAVDGPVLSPAEEVPVPPQSRSNLLRKPRGGDSSAAVTMRRLPVIGNATRYSSRAEGGSGGSAGPAVSSEGQRPARTARKQPVETGFFNRFFKK